MTAEDIVANAKNLSITVAEAQVKWGYRVVADLRLCAMKREGGAWSLSSRISLRDTFGFDSGRSQQSLSVVVPSRNWTWPIVSLQTVDGVLTARLGPKG